jgi:CheY-like chemotaxis protein
MDKTSKRNGISDLLDLSYFFAYLIPTCKTPGMRSVVADNHSSQESVRFLALVSPSSSATRPHRGLEAIRLAKATQSHVIILDRNTPIMSGFEAAVEIQHILPTCPSCFSQCTPVHSLWLEKPASRDLLKRTAQESRGSWRHKR